MIYMVDLFYSDGSPFRAFFNNHIFVDSPAYERSAVRFPCHPYCIKGTNTITIAWGEIPIDDANKNFSGYDGDVPDFAVQLRAKNDWGDEGRILFQQELSAKNIAKYKGNKIPAYIISFENPGTIAFDSLLTGSIVCNETEDDLIKYFTLMRDFSFSIYKSLLHGSKNTILRSAKVAIKDGAMAAGMSEEAYFSQFNDALQEVQTDGVGYKLTSQNQFVFLPTCGGRLWRVGVMHDAETARSINNSVSKLPHAIIRTDKELIQGGHSGGLSLKIPVYLGFPDGKCEIVRVV